MQQFATALLSPRTIAWLIKLDGKEELKRIVEYNSAMRGGYYNVLIPVTDEGAILSPFDKFLIEYDPDLIILPPELASEQFLLLNKNFYPFGCVEWEMLDDFLSNLPDKYIFHENALQKRIAATPPNIKPTSLVAVTNNKFPDTSLLSLVACGDITTQDTGLGSYRERFLNPLLETGFETALANLAENLAEHGISATESARHQSVDLIPDENKFPITDVTKILQACYELQLTPTSYFFEGRVSFLGLTKEGVNSEYIDKSSIPSLTVIVSSSFGVKEASLFWNLRALDTYVAWLPSSELIANISSISEWIKKFEASYSTWRSLSRNTNIIFSYPDEEFSILETVIQEISLQSNKICVLRKYEESLPAIPIRPYFSSEKVFVAQDESRCSFVTRLLENNDTGMRVISLEWDTLLLPQNQAFLNLISLEKEGRLPIINEIAGKYFAVDKRLPRFRIAKNRCLRIQAHQLSTTPIIFNKPTAFQIFKALFISSHYTSVEESSTARYHTNFVNRAGSLEKAGYYLRTSPYKELFELLSNNKSKGKLGWILENPSKRRVLHHLHLREILKAATSESTKNYFDRDGDLLPQEAIELLQSALLERGFLLNCRACSYESWYPVELVGQNFQCSRCFQEQVYTTNPFWLYKLPEVIFQGLNADNMQVPLLALDFLRRKSRKNFEWIPDSNIYWISPRTNKTEHKNVDLLCIVDGKVYIGEAKSNDLIEEEQFSFYEDLCKRLSLDGIIFATSTSNWSAGTTERIKRLEPNFEGEIIILTSNELYKEVKVSFASNL